jgi:hypothetical protein
MVGGRNWAVCQSKDVLATKRGMGEASSTKVQVAGLKTIGLYDSMLCESPSSLEGRLLKWLHKSPCLPDISCSKYHMQAVSSFLYAFIHIRSRTKDWSNTPLPKSLSTLSHMIKGSEWSSNCSKNFWHSLRPSSTLQAGDYRRYAQPASSSF